MEALLSDLAAALDAVMDPLDAWLQETAPKPVQEPAAAEVDRPVDPAAARALLEKLAGMLDEGDFECARVVEDLAALMGRRSAVAEIRELVDGYDFEAAKARVEALMAAFDGGEKGEG
jgi:hypothetical protein